jgi:MoaA/NifB/PqqE/SkfB family radical SAM enzyme
MKKIPYVKDTGSIIKNLDKTFMMIFLLEECNFSCEHCVRDEEPMPSGYKLSYHQLQEFLKDCQKLETIERVHFSGGEPTLWKEGNRDLTDLLIEISKAGFTPGFTTNGSNLVDFTVCKEFLNRYFKDSYRKLHLFISIDTFHRNFDASKGRTKSLDNVLKYQKELPPDKEDIMSITVLVTISKGTESLLPKGMIDYYQSQGVEFSFIPMGLKGKARSMSHLCPNLKSNKSEDLGAYYPYHKEKIENKHNLILIDNDYYIYFSDESIEFPKRWYKIASLGHLVDIY